MKRFLLLILLVNIAYVFVQGADPSVKAVSLKFNAAAKSIEAGK